ncbi:hypothetical protein Sjap_007637 [Stephania japonica]|uniref:Uncharacterized protein n=1 Tax=Stephania japonica TaxID=461633 RepID=A0AAP0JPN2_9MAGN
MECIQMNAETYLEILTMLKIFHKILKVEACLRQLTVKCDKGVTKWIISQKLT